MEPMNLTSMNKPFVLVSLRPLFCGLLCGNTILQEKVFLFSIYLHKVFYALNENEMSS